MGIRGRPSAAELSTVVDIGFRRRKPAPPGELTDAQAAVWRDCIGSISIARGAYPILIEYCRRVCRSRLLEAQIVAFELEWTKVPGGLERFDRLLGMADRRVADVHGAGALVEAHASITGPAPHRGAHDGRRAGFG